MGNTLDKIMVLASTFPNSSADSVPTFVQDQIKMFKLNNPNTEFIVIAPSYKGRKPEKSNYYTHIRYRYFFSRYEKLTEKGILPTIKTNVLYIGVIPFFILFQIIFTLNLARKYKPDYIYAHWVMPQALTALFIYKLLGIPYVFSTHAHDAEILGKVPIIGPILLNNIVKSSKKFTADSGNTEMKLKKYISNSNWDSKKNLVLPMGVNNLHIDNSTPEKVIQLTKNNSLKITFVGRFVEKKGVEGLIEVFSQIVKKYKNIELILCGAGYLEETYRELIRKNHIQDKVQILTFFNDINKLVYVYETSDIVIVPSIVAKNGDVEGLPVVSLEALYLGKILVASHESNVGEVVVNGENGFLYSSNEPDELFVLLENIINDKYDLIKLSENALMTGEKFSIENTSLEYYSHLFH